MDVALWFIGGIWTLASLGALGALALVPRVPATPSETPPRVAVIVAARDEEDRIGQTARRLLAQQGVDLRVVVVDDRSTDRTPDILRAVAAEDSRLLERRVEALPDGWLGKCHACWVGAQLALADGACDWLLFLDADVWLAPEVISRAVAEGVRSGAEHVTISPNLARSRGFGPAACLAGLTVFTTRAAMANLRVPGQQVGIGGFNLVRSSVYERFGGHEALRLEIVDDLYLAVLANRAGARTRVLRSAGDVEVDYGVSLRGLLAVTRKNNFAIFRFNTPVAVAAIAVFLAVWLAALGGPVLDPSAGWVALAGLLTTTVPAAVYARLLGWSVWNALLAPFAQGALPLMLLNSMAAAHREGGVRWRETLYPIEQLRAGRVR